MGGLYQSWRAGVCQRRPLTVLGDRVYLALAILTRGAHNVFCRGRYEISHSFFADLVFLKIIFNLGRCQSSRRAEGNLHHTSVWSVWAVPLLSTGEGSTVAGYGLGGCRWSEVFEDLEESIRSLERGTMSKSAGQHTYLKRPEPNWPANWDCPCKD